MQFFFPRILQFSLHRFIFLLINSMSTQIYTNHVTRLCLFLIFKTKHYDRYYYPTA